MSKRQSQRVRDLQRMVEHERLLSANLIADFTQQGVELAKKYRQYGNLLNSDFIHSNNKIEGHLIQHMTNTFMRFNKLTNDRIARSVKQLTSAEEAALQWARVHAAGQIANITATTTTFINAIITRGLEEGLTTTEIASTIIEQVPTMARSRARTIARTEIHKAANAGAHQAAADLPIPVTKTWTAKLDSRTRDSHREADGQTVPLNEHFNIGGHEIHHPGDGPPGEAINCRCVLTYNADV